MTIIAKGFNRLFVLALAVLVTTGCSDLNSQENPEPYYHAAKLIEVMPEQSYMVNRKFTATVVAKQQTNVAFEFSGRILAIYKDNGDQVAQGDVLATLDTELLNIRAKELSAQIKQNDAQITLNNANLKRVKALIKKGYTSEQSVDELIAEKSVLNANNDRLRASLATLEYQIAKSELKAPYAGTLVNRMVAQGDIVNAGTPAFKLIKRSQQEITVGVPMKIASQLAVSQQLPVIINNKEVMAAILSVGQEINAINRTVQIRLALVEADQNFNGQLAQVAITEHINQVGYWLPLSSLTDGIRGQWNIYQAIKQEGNTYKLAAQTADILHTTKTHAYISTSASDALTLVAEGLHRYVPGQQVHMAPATNATKEVN